VVVTGIEKVLPSLSDLATVMRLLPRSASGQAISNYFTLLTGPKRTEDADGPEHLYFVLVDSGRTELIGSDLQDMLRCIRCGACMNHCPVYQKIGGHTYGWVYPGPMGSVLTPTYVGIENALDLPQASTLCGQCDVVCPVKIPLPDLLRKLRQRQFAAHLRPWMERAGLAVWGFFATRPKLYRIAARLASGFLARWAGGARKIRHIPGGWSQGRDLPAPSGKTFRDWYAEQQESTKK
jgi:L-lactate dehydrogenase complex protein LldF